MNRTFALSTYLKRLFGENVRKIPLDAGFSCPNRDGTISRTGCIFCNPNGSGSGMLDRGLSLAGQWAFWHDLHSTKHHTRLFIAYLQSFSNTHGPIEKLADTLSSMEGLPGLAAIAIGTRPDCLDEAKLDLLAARREALGLPVLFLELGLQSANDATLRCINRGHDAAAFAHAAKAAAERGLSVVAHVMAGLPTTDGREGTTELLDTIDMVNGLPVSGIKFHNTFVCRNTPLTRLYEQGGYTPLTLDEYLEQLAAALAHLSPRTVVHRLNGNPAFGELVAPEWAGNMRRLHNRIREHLDTVDVWQGQRNGAEAGMPEWFGAR
ncbi:TIGR01212 family radical SAM protein [Pseudodesulfovibrio sp.]|uniref:TIGR01212 family radical SAM protein n=1 Tax=unclassified Pseudodesulfovibrio TaxID=2661612 RepID=UPI003B007812